MELEKGSWFIASNVSGAAITTIGDCEGKVHEADGGRDIDSEEEAIRARCLHDEGEIRHFMIEQCRSLDREDVERAIDDATLYFLKLSKATPKTPSVFVRSLVVPTKLPGGKVSRFKLGLNTFRMPSQDEIRKWVVNKIDDALNLGLSTRKERETKREVPYPSNYLKSEEWKRGDLAIVIYSSHKGCVGKMHVVWEFQEGMLGVGGPGQVLLGPCRCRGKQEPQELRTVVYGSQLRRPTEREVQELGWQVDGGGWGELEGPSMGNDEKRDRAVQDKEWIPSVGETIIPRRPPKDIVILNGAIWLSRMNDCDGKLHLVTRVDIENRIVRAKPSQCCQDKGGPDFEGWWFPFEWCEPVRVGVDLATGKDSTAIMNRNLDDVVITGEEDDTEFLEKLAKASGETVMVNGKRFGKPIVMMAWAELKRKMAEVKENLPDHGNVAGLNYDDHTQYQFLAGRTGGQTLVGGIAASDDRTLSIIRPLDRFLLVRPDGNAHPTRDFDYGQCEGKLHVVREVRWNLEDGRFSGTVVAMECLCQGVPTSNTVPLFWCRSLEDASKPETEWEPIEYGQSAFVKAFVEAMEKEMVRTAAIPKELIDRDGRWPKTSGSHISESKSGTLTLEKLEQTVQDFKEKFGEEPLKIIKCGERMMRKLQTRFPHCLEIPNSGTLHMDRAALFGGVPVVLDPDLDPDEFRIVSPGQARPNMNADPDMKKLEEATQKINRSIAEQTDPYKTAWNKRLKKLRNYGWLFNARTDCFERTVWGVKERIPPRKMAEEIARMVRREEPGSIYVLFRGRRWWEVGVPTGPNYSGDEFTLTAVKGIDGEIYMKGRGPGVLKSEAREAILSIPGVLDRLRRAGHHDRYNFGFEKILDVAVTQPPPHNWSSLPKPKEESLVELASGVREALFAKGFVIRRKG